jgi:hypothetical protein
MLTEAKPERDRVSVKSKIVQYAPAFVAGAIVSASVAIVVVRRMYYPGDTIAMQLPYDILREMREDGKTILMNTKVGWISVMWHAEDPSPRWENP